MIKIEMKGAEFDNFLMILRKKLNIARGKRTVEKCSLLTLKTSYRTVE